MRCLTSDTSLSLLDRSVAANRPELARIGLKSLSKLIRVPALVSIRTIRSQATIELTAEEVDDW